MSPEVEKVKSLQWAIEELSKQKDELDGKLKIARKREETGSLIEEVNAQKDALDRRISALQDGLHASTELVDTPVDFLEDEISKINDKLGIAQERLQNLEQEQYLEELGRKLNRSQADDFSESLSQVDDFTSLKQPIDLPSSSNLQESISEEKELSTNTQTMTIASNRIESENMPSIRPSDKVSTERTQNVHSENITPVPVEGLEETAAKLGVEPEFLVEKGTKAILRMIARNGGQLRFPLEIDQLD